MRQTAHFFFLFVLSMRYMTKPRMLATEPNAPKTSKKSSICIAPFRENFPQELYIRLLSAPAGDLATVFI